jgi:copper chaperone NosL
MKKIAPFLIILLFVVIIVLIFLSLGKTQHMVVIKEGNLKQVPLEIELHKYQDSYCGMIIDDLKYASQVVAPDGKTWFFHDHGDFVLWLENKPFKESAKVWVMSRDTHKWIDGKKAYYSRDEVTPMGFGFGAYENKKKGLIGFDEMQLFTLRGETMQDPKIKKMLTDK